MAWGRRLTGKKRCNSVNLTYSRETGKCLFGVRSGWNLLRSVSLSALVGPPMTLLFKHWLPLTPCLPRDVGSDSYGCSPGRGQKWSYGYIVPGPVAIVLRPLIGRHWAGTRPASTVVARGLEHRWLSQQFQLSAMIGLTMGDVAGGIPPHKGGPKARSPNYSGQRGRRLA